MIKIGMTLYVTDEDYNFIIPNVMYHRHHVEKIYCIAHKPSRLMKYQINKLSKDIDNFEYIGDRNEPYTVENHVAWTNHMIMHLGIQGIEWVINAYPNEFYYGNIGYMVTEASKQDYNLLLTDGFCFYQTVRDLYDLNPVRSMFYRDPDGTEYQYKKSIHRTQDFKTTTPGDHWIRYDKTPVKQAFSKGLQILRFQYNSKKVEGWRPLDDNEIKEKNLTVDRRLEKLFDNWFIPV